MYVANYLATISLQCKSKMSAPLVPLCYNYFLTLRDFKMTQLNMHSNFGALKKNFLFYISLRVICCFIQATPKMPWKSLPDNNRCSHHCLCNNAKATCTKQQGNASQIAPLSLLQRSDQVKGNGPVSSYDLVNK